VKSRHGFPHGFTLIEVLIALAIMVGAILVLSNAWSGSFTRVRKSQLYNNVAELLERKMTEIEVQFQGRSVNEITAQEGDFGSDFPQYRWTFEVQEFVMPDLTSLMASQQAVAQNLVTMMNQLSELMGQSIREVTLTVFVKNGDKEMPFSVTNYFVDFNREINIPGLAGAGGGGGNQQGGNQQGGAQPGGGGSN
jgi:general secretion pathway protein I